MICREQNINRNSLNNAKKQQKYNFIYVDKTRQLSKRNLLEQFKVKT